MYHPDTDQAGPACSSFELISLDTGKTYATATIERN